MFEDAPSIEASKKWQIIWMNVVLILGYGSLSIAKSSRVYLFEQAQCLLYYQTQKSPEAKAAGNIEEKLCKIDPVQYPLSIVVGVDTLLSLLPGKI